ncbi:MAG: hypothetical protein QME47_06570 [Candidatus Thermoplasmatota archaeon]|nr:hypothetical protein [Candidatus Thermoplasmatota archaeon]
MKNSKAQLLLLAIAILAIALILIATSATVLLNVKRDSVQEISENLGNDFKELRLNFGYALEDELTNKRAILDKDVDDTNNTTVRQAINESILRGSSQFEYLQALKGRIFNASWNSSSAECFYADDRYRNISINTTLVLHAKDFSIAEFVKYKCEWNITASRYEVKNL